MNFHISEQQFTLLQAWVQETGLSMAEALRRALDAYLAQWARQRPSSGAGED